MAQEDDVPALVSSSDNESDCGDDKDDLWEDLHDDSDEDEMSMLAGDVTCLFCAKTEPSVDAVISHCKMDHNFDLLACCHRWSVDCIGYIKLINFCRKEHPLPDQVIQGLMSGGLEWQADEFMQAFDPSDLMLQFDIESGVEDNIPFSPLKSSASEFKDFTNNFSDLDDGHMTKSSDAIVALTSRVRAAEEQRDLLRSELDRVLQDMEKLKLSGKQLMMNAMNSVGDVSQGSSTNMKKTANNLSDEDGYFASYSHHGIHMTMLKDEMRTRSYHDFMVCNPHLFEGKTVLDVGCGTGILSMFAVQAGARQVVAVDSSQIIYQAMDIARENKMHDKIVFVKGRLEDVTLPIEKFDVVISEWMGYFLLFEAMLDSVLWARDRYLAPGGCVYPDRFTMKVVGVSDPELYQQTIGYWDDVYGFKMSCMKGPVLEEVQVCTVRGNTVATEPAVIKEIEVSSCQVADLDFHSDFSLTCLIDAQLTAIVGYFDTYFIENCHQKIHFSTGPKSVKTHWEQAVMILPKPLQVKKGSSVDCKITYRKHPHDTRGVIINLTVGEMRLKYTLA